MRVAWSIVHLQTTRRHADHPRHSTLESTDLLHIACDRQRERAGGLVRHEARNVQREGHQRAEQHNLNEDQALRQRTLEHPT
eukprot:15440418-Alexandrium_andersonii.AAC.1